jgi:excisionase family DNA binding protein
MPAPTEKQLDFAKVVAKLNGLIVPTEVTKDMHACAKWLDEHYEHIPPTKALVEEAMKLAHQIGINPSTDALSTAQKLKFWITSKTPRPLTKVQMSALEENAPGSVLSAVDKGDYATGRQYLNKFYTRYTAYKQNPKVPPEGYLTRKEVMKQLKLQDYELWTLMTKGELIFDDTYIPAIITPESVDEYLRRKKRNMEGLISISEACKQLHVNYEKVMELMDKNVLQFERVEGFKNVLIHRESLKNYVPPEKGARVTNLKIAYPGYITVQEAAKKLKLYPDAIKTLAKTGRLECITRDTVTNNILIKETCELTDIMTIKEAATLLNVTTHKVSKQHIEGKLETFLTDNGKILVSLSSVRKALNIPQR